MNLGRCCCLGPVGGTRSSSCCQSYLKLGYVQIRCVHHQCTSSRFKIPRWRVLWCKMKKEKKRFSCSTDDTAAEVHVHYDPDSYSKNFDDGLCTEDPDDILRSFSARFAVPARVFDKS